MMTPSSLTNNFMDDDWIFTQLTNKNFFINDSLKSLNSKQWYVFKCSPISNFKIEHFREKLNNALLLQGIKFSDYSVALVPELAVSDKDDPTLKIELISKGPRTQLYTGLFISRASECTRRNNFMSLPLLFCEGSYSLITSVNKILEKLFDNSISPINFSNNELVTLGLLTSLNCSYEDGAFITFKYSYPGLEKTSITYEIDLKNFINLWKTICASQSVSGFSNLNLFYSEIQMHFKNVYGIDLSFFTLVSITIVNICTLKSNGMIKTKVPETLDYLMRYITRHGDFENRV